MLSLLVEGDVQRLFQLVWRLEHARRDVMPRIDAQCVGYASYTQRNERPQTHD